MQLSFSIKGTTLSPRSLAKPRGLIWKQPKLRTTFLFQADEHHHLHCLVLLYNRFVCPRRTWCWNQVLPFLPLTVWFCILGKALLSATDPGLQSPPDDLSASPQPRAVFAFLHFRSPLPQLPVSSQLSHCGKAQGKQLSFPCSARLVFIRLSLPQPCWRNLRRVTGRKKPLGLYLLSIWSGTILWGR